MARTGLLGIVARGSRCWPLPSRQGASYSWQVQLGDWSVASNWGGTLPSSSDTACVANGGTVNVTVSETCGTMSLGSGAGSGAVQMASGYLETLGYQNIGSSGPGAFVQSGGTNASGEFFLGSASGGNGTYALSGSGLLMSSQEFVGYSGTGSFAQAGGLNTNRLGLWNVFLYLGYNTGASGTYSLSGNGKLSAYAESVGCSGTGSFSQSGGTNTAGIAATPGGITLGGNAGGSGTYNLSGSGLLSVFNENVGGSGTGNFIQSGGTNSATYLYLGGSVGSSGSYALSGPARCR